MSSSQASIEALYATGHWLLSAERFADAALVLRAMARAAPSDERAWLALGTCHEAVGQPDIAASLYHVAAALAAPAIRCRLALARSLRAAGREDEASEALERARSLALDGDDDELCSLAEREIEATP